MRRQTRVMRDKAKLREHLRDEHGSRLLTIHADSECLRPPKEKERVERREGIAHSIDSERDVLQESPIL